MAQTIYKTEKRKARVGERILVTDKNKNEQQYKNGEIFDVSKLGNGYVRDPMHVPIFDHEYEVIIGEYTSTPNLDEMSYDELVALIEAVVKTIRTRSYKNGYDQGRFESPKSDQQKRDEIVAQAKEDVETLKMRNRLSKAFTIQVIERPKSRSVEATAKVPNSRKAFYGIAKCVPNDCYNVHIGKAIALRRALGLEVPPEYLTLPQPTEVRVGDVVRGRTAFRMDTYEETVRRIAGGKYEYASGGYDYVDKVNLVIIDDSRTEGGA
ncbi:hypothetical protein AB0R69_19995 (plasmid) [Bacillus pumilus]|uniref:hypothetical protein n=1 Tax=Bacillus pumilus TaxID=1408 RepID=UPI00345411E3